MFSSSSDSNADEVNTCNLGSVHTQLYQYESSQMLQTSISQSIEIEL